MGLAEIKLATELKLVGDGTMPAYAANLLFRLDRRASALVSMCMLAPS